MDLNDLAGEAKDLIVEHGDDLKDVAEDLKDVVTGDGSVADKAKAALGAVKEDLT